jgi:carboxymethylenebutenolidase
MAIRANHINFAGLHSYVAQPESPSGRGVLLLPTIFGIDTFVQYIADSLAAAGFTTLIWDPYCGQPLPGTVPEASARAKTLEDEASLSGMSNCVGYMLGELHLKAIGALGFCLGGRFGLLLCARDRRLGACLTYYPSIRVPQLPNQHQDAVALAAEINCPVQLVYPGQDHVIERETFLQLQATLQKRQAPTIVQFYPEASHSFMTLDRSPGEVDKAAARISWPQAIAFLSACLAPTMYGADHAGADEASPDPHRSTNHELRQCGPNSAPAHTTGLRQDQ